MKRSLSLLVLVLALALVAAACSSGDDAALVSDGTLTVCSEVPYEPFEFEDPSSPWPRTPPGSVDGEGR